MENYNLVHGLLTISEGTEILLSETFAERLDIEKVVLPSSLREIGGAAFAGCENLTSVSFSGEKHLEQICDGAFTLCHNLVSYDFNDGLTSIGEMAFWESALKNVSLPKGLLSLGDSAFWSCPNLVSFNVFEKNCQIGVDVIGDCPSLVEGYVAPGFPSASYYNQADELNYSLLYLSCPQRHDSVTAQRAASFIRNQMLVVMERILEQNNTPAMTGLVSEHLLEESDLNRYLEEATRRGLSEITTLLLESKRKRESHNRLEDFDL